MNDQWTGLLVGQQYLGQNLNHIACDQQQPDIRTRSRGKQLACLSCRRKKVKCHASSDGSGPCRLCRKTGTECITPEIDERKLSNSRKTIRELSARIVALENELTEHRTYCGTLAKEFFESQELSLSPEPSSATSEGSSASDNMIVRLCGGQRQLNSDRVGRLRFFGPTSSLHLSESVTSSVLTRESNGTRGWHQWQDFIPLELQAHLLDLYWKFQYQMVPIIHKEAFLRDFESGQTKYCSKLLVCCMLTRAAAISDQPEIRSLALAEDDTNEDPPYLVSKCASLLDAELNRPGISTLQALQLLSEIYCVISNDTKGRLDAGGACRLAFELGLHTDSQTLGCASLTQVDLEARQIALWSCVSFDRIWALYLGRPQMIKMEDITAQRPDHPPPNASPEMKMSAAWASLLDIVGSICDALNGVQTTKHRVTSLDRRLREWCASLDIALHYNSQQSPAIILLHMQYAAANILLHRPLAQFGNAGQVTMNNVSRQICVQHACLIAHYLKDYNEQQGSAMTLSWIALHIVATASTTLIANIAEHSGRSNEKLQLSCLQMCIRALNELEKSHLPTKRARRVIQHAMRLLDLDDRVNTAQPLREFRDVPLPSIFLSLTDMSWVNGASCGDTLVSEISEAFSFDEFLPAGSQTDMLHSFGSLFA